MKDTDNLKVENQLCFSLYAASREVIRLYKPCLDKFNLTYTQYVVMLSLWEENRSTVKDIGAKLHLDSGTLTPVLKKLEARGFVTRQRDTDDDRVVIIELTDEGKELKDKIKCIPHNVFMKCNITEAEAKVLKAGLDNLLLKMNNK